MILSNSINNISLKYSKLSQKLIKNILSLLLFFFLFFIFLKKFILINSINLNIDNNFGNYYRHISLNTIKGKPFDPYLYSMRYDFGSEESGTKIIAYSKSLSNLYNILNYDTETYMLAPCRTNDWFVLSFPESILIQQITFLSREFYASSYKNIRISVSNIFPSNKWLTLAELETDPSRDEIFDISVLCNSEKNDCWGKFLKVELLDYHRFEDNYYCSITKMNIFGITAVEYLESEVGDEISVQDSLQPPVLSKVESTVETKTKEEVELKDSCTKILPAPENISFTKNSHLKCLTKTEDELTPTFVYNIKSTIIKGFYKFLMRISLRPDTDFHNRKLLYRILKIGKFKKYCGTNLLFHFNCNRFITYLLLDKYSLYYSKILDFVKLPSKHVWFEYILFDFIKNKRHLVDSIMNDVGVKEAPVLVCVETFGVVTKFNCYFYLNLKSFSTLLFKKYSGGFKDHLPRDFGFNQYSKVIDPVCLVDKFYFYYADNRTSLKRSLYKSKSVVKQDGKFLKSLNYTVNDDFISSIRIIEDKLYITLSPNTSGSNYYDQSIYNPNWNKEIVKSETAIHKTDFLSNITRYLDNRNRCYNIKKFTKKKVELDKKQMVVQEDLTRKDPKSHKHVLLNLSERVKSLEYLTNKLSNKIYQTEEFLGINLTIPLQAAFQDRTKIELERQIDDILKILNITKFRMMSRRGLKTKGELGVGSGFWYYRRVKKNKGYEVGDLYLRGEDLEYFLGNLCKLKKCEPYNIKCKKIMFLYKLSWFCRYIKKNKLAKCILNYNCRCLYPMSLSYINQTDYKDWVFVTNFKSDNKYFLFIKKQVKLFKARIMKYFNIYFMFGLFLISQIYWMCKYNIHNKQIHQLILLTNTT